jgi:hypothetical protein
MQFGLVQGLSMEKKTTADSSKVAVATLLRHCPKRQFSGMPVLCDTIVSKRQWTTGSQLFTRWNDANFA